MRKEIDHVFTYHQPRNAQEVDSYQDIRMMAKAFANFLDRKLIESKEKEEAINKIRESVMWVNAGIALHGLNVSEIEEIQKEKENA